MAQRNSVAALKLQLLGAIFGVLVAVLSLSTATYAWYVANSTVTAATSTISAKTNGFVLQINDAASGADHGSGVKSLEASMSGGVLSPASTDDLKNWYICESMNDAGNVVSYVAPNFDKNHDPNALPGQYTLDKKYFAFIRSDYIVYTISETGLADVYLEDDGTEAPVVITMNNGSGVSTFTDSLRVAITTESVDSYKHGLGNEELKVVYAVKNETGQGNDDTGKDGWTSIQNVGGTPKLDFSTYKYISGNTSGGYQDQDGKNWAATRTGDNYTVRPGTMPIATGVDYNGTIIHVYIWMEGTDADCINGKAIENDTTKYDVTVKLAGVATGS